MMVSIDHRRWRRRWDGQFSFSTMPAAGPSGTSMSSVPWSPRQDQGLHMGGLSLTLSSADEGEYTALNVLVFYWILRDRDKIGECHLLIQLIHQHGFYFVLFMITTLHFCIISLINLAGTYVLNKPWHAWYPFDYLIERKIWVNVNVQWLFSIWIYMHLSYWRLGS